MKNALTILCLCFISGTLPAWSTDLKGTVKDAQGDPLPGVSVFLEGTSKGAATNGSGEYMIRNIQPGKYLLVASMLGYSTEKRGITITEQAAPLEINFTLDQIALDLGEVMVTANKYGENLQTVATAVSAISADNIRDFSIKDRTDLSCLSPNSLIAETGSHMTDLINIRGMFPSTPFGATSLFYYDGVPIYGYGMNPMYLNDIERIEVIRGPQGTLYGRNALAGVINIVSQKPNNIAHRTVGLDFGNFNEKKFSLGISQPLVRDELFLRVSGYYATRDGYYTNTFLKQNAGGSTGYGGTVNLRWFPSEAFSAELFANMEDIDESIWPFASDPVTAMKSPYGFQNDLASSIKKRNTIGSLKLNYRIADMEIVSTTAYQGISKMDWKYDADFSPLDYFSFVETSPYHIWSQELRVQSVTSSSPLKWIAGLFYSADFTDNQYSAILGKIWAQANQVPISPIHQTTAGEQTTKDLSAFGQVTYTFFDRIDLTAGMRIERQTIDRNTTTRYLFHGGPAPIPAPPFNVIDTSILQKEFNFVSPKVSVGYRFDALNFVYASASRGFHGGGFNSSVNRFVPYYEPEYTWNYEVGYKTELFDNTLRLNADVFLIDWRKQQLLTIGDLSSPFQTITNAGTTTSKGLEMEVSVLPFRGLSLTGSFGLLDVKLDEFSFHETKNGKDTLYDYAGNVLPFAPKFSSFVSAKYEYPFRFFGMDARGILVADYHFVDPYYMSHLNQFKSAARHLLGGKIGVSFQQVDVFFWAKNLLDYRYVYAAYEYRGGQNAYLGNPRTVGLSIDIRY